jgi:hypothetical protein
MSAHAGLLVAKLELTGASELAGLRGTEEGER